MNFQRPTNAARRRGVTLTELLIVMLVMLMITAIAIPAIAPAMQNRELREAARMIDAFINGARSRALQAGHPFGIMLEREPGNPNAVSTLSYVEQPDAWQGDYGQSTAGSGSTIMLLGNGGFGALLPPGPPVSFVVDQSAPVFPMGDVGWINNIAPGDIMTIKGVDYRIYAGEPFIDLDGNGYWTIANGPMPNEPFLDVDGNGKYTQPLPPSGTPTIDFSTGYFNQIPQPFAYASGAPGAFMTYAPADPVAAAALMNSTGLTWYGVGDLRNGAPILFGPPPSTSLSAGQQFTINRRPVKTAAGSIQLPGDAVIDLGANYPDQQYSIIVPIPGSGLEVIQSQQNATGYWSTFRANPSLDPIVPGSLASGDVTLADRSSIMITFQPNGTVDQVYSWSESGMNYSQGGSAWQTTTVNWTNWQGRIPISTIYILVGRRDLINGDPNLISHIASGTPPLKPIYNVQDPNALWIAINPRNGQVATTDNVGFDLTESIPTNAGMTGQNSMQMQIYFAANVYYSRRLAREQLDMGGR